MNYLKQGDIVTIIGKMDDRIRESDDNRCGTIIQISGETIHVLLPNGNIWVGIKRDVTKQ